MTEAIPPQLSLAVTVAGFTGGTKSAHMTVTFCGQVMEGGTWSFTVMVCVHVALFPQSSVALYVRNTLYRFAQVWLMIRSLTKLTVTTPEQLSLAVGAAIFG